MKADELRALYVKSNSNGMLDFDRFARLVSNSFENDYPNSDEVCKALGELIGDEVRFINGKFCYLHKGATSHFLDSGVRTFTLEQLLKVPHLITLIGRFYEGLEKKARRN